MASQPSSLSTNPQDSPFHDPAEGILKGDITLSDSDRESLWDEFHGAKDPAALAQKLQPLSIPSETKHALWTAKSATSAPSPVEKVKEALQQLSRMDAATLDIAEKHPKISQAFIDAAVKPELPKMPSGEAAAKSKAAPKGKPSKAASAAPSIVPDLPATPSGHALVLASDLGVHHVPVTRMDAARKIDPGLKVLHVEP